MAVAAPATRSPHTPHALSRETLAARWFFALILVQGFHELEHIVQVYQRFVLHNQKGAGILGTWIDVEPIHFAYNGVFLFALLVTYYLGGFLTWDQRKIRPLVWWLFSFSLMFQSYHFTEHIVKFVQYLQTGLNGTPGILGQDFNLVWLHLVFNTVAFVPALLAFFIGKYNRQVNA